MPEAQYCVRAVHCDHRANDEAVYNALCRATAPLTRAWHKLQQAQKIVIKFNQDWPLDSLPMFEGLRQQLVCDSVVRATLRLLRERTQAKLYCADASFHVIYKWVESLEESTSIAHILREFDVEYLDGTQPPFKMVRVPGGGQMFEQYLMMQQPVEADALVSVAKMKNHGFMGFTACLKNLFGLMPGIPYGRPRHYYHHQVRMPYVLADIGRIFKPALNIVDALTGQAGSEWGQDGSLGRVVDTLLAGDHVVATDACTVHLMGHDPSADYPALPFYRERNMLRVAAEKGFGTVNLKEIDFQSEVDPQPAGTFFAKERVSRQMEFVRRRTMCEQALYYHNHPQKFEAYAGEYILLQDGEVRWHDVDGGVVEHCRKKRGPRDDHAMFFKFVDPEEAEGEHYEVYDSEMHYIQTLERNNHKKFSLTLGTLHKN